MTIALTLGQLNVVAEALREKAQRQALDDDRRHTQALAQAFETEADMTRIREHAKTREKLDELTRESQDVPGGYR